jgi:hypothetical protein
MDLSVRTQKCPFSLDLAAELSELERSKNLTLINVGNTPAKSFLLSQIFEKTNFQNVFWASTDEKADQIMLSANLFFEGRVYLIPAEASIEKFYELRAAFLKEEKSLFLFENIKEVLEQDLPTTAEIDAEKLVLRRGKKFVFMRYLSIWKKSAMCRRRISVCSLGNLCVEENSSLSTR